MVAVCLEMHGPSCSIQVWQMPLPGQQAACLGSVNCWLCNRGLEELQLQHSFAVSPLG